MKMAYTLLLPALLFLTSCQLAVDTVNSGVRMINSCCKNLSVNDNKAEYVEDAEVVEDFSPSSSHLLLDIGIERMLVK